MTSLGEHYLKDLGDPEQIFQSSVGYTDAFETPPGDLPVFLAYRLNGKPIPPVRGGPVRMVVPWAHRPTRG